MSIGPVEYGVVAFPGNKFKGEIAPALRELVDSGTIRIVDLAFVLKDADGSVVAGELEDTGSDVFKAFENLSMERGGLINEDDLKDIGEALDNESSALVIVWEDVWAARLAEAVRNAGGQVIEMQRIPADVVQAAIDFDKAEAATTSA